MKINYAAVGVFVLSAVLLFSVGLFLIGNRQKAFGHHLDFFTLLNNVNGISPGSKVRVSGFEAGQVTGIEIPDRPADKFRIILHVDSKLHRLIRDDSFVTVESDGLVGDKFLVIHKGSDQAGEVAIGATLPANEPIELSAVIAKATGVMDQANAAIGDIKARVDGTLDAVTTTVNNTNALVTGIRNGNGTVGMLLTDQQTANKVKDTVGNAQQAAANLNQVTVQAKQVMANFQSRELFGKAEATLNNTKDASRQIAQASQQINLTLNDALGPDRSGENAAQNIRETFSNVNLATANMADDTEALKHEFFFRGFFKKRGYYSLRGLTPDQYRSNSYLNSQRNRRTWLDAADAFGKDSNGNEFLSAAGEQAIDQVIGTAKDSVIGQPIIVEGYSNQASPANEIVTSRSRSLIVAHYLEKHFHLSAKKIGVIALNATAPPSSGKNSWDGACIVLVANAK
ncbi:MAG: MlaD family protein [Terriglobales bacterium]|jgi:phospholipid/cholesterol/gamma-HCH transport system substrate-binding protein